MIFWPRHYDEWVERGEKSYDWDYLREQYRSEMYTPYGIEMIEAFELGDDVQSAAT